jgi:bacterioferritin (cytochrome b1)
MPRNSGEGSSEGKGDGAAERRVLQRRSRRCGANRDAASKPLFEALVGDEETHFDGFSRQMDLIVV